jgi:tetratricopeptide (TPR) repeat protein
MAAPMNPPFTRTVSRPPWAQVRALFEQVVVLPATERQAVLEREAADNALAAEVWALLLQHEAEESGPPRFLAQPARVPTAPPDRRGQRLGPWRLTQPLGSGGMGDVWEAQRDDGAYEARVAVKLLQTGQDGAELLLRFQQEQRLLARLNHPHIARLLDAGQTEDGKPYFVMEAVDGRPLDEACRGLPLAARLNLFLQLADAVAHAHKQGLVHRDLKPANVLVDAENQVKLLDFGIARALDHAPEAADAPRPLTPGYASPEQVRGEPLAPSTDVYSLGVLLYQVLTGVRPLGREARTPDAVLKAVLEEQPQRPSALDSAVATDPVWQQLRAQLAGDLDHIVLKALDKHAGQRYSGVQALAADLRAHLDGRPVAAQRATPVYLAVKFVRRHRWAVAAAALGGLGLASTLAALLLQGRALAALGLVAGGAGLVLALWQAGRAERARARAERHVAGLRKLASRVVFEYHDGIRHLQGATAIRQAMLADAADYLQEIEDTARQDPRGAYELARMAHRLALLEGSTYSEGLEQTDRAEASYARALRLVEVACGPQQRDPDVLLECASIVADAAEFDQRQGRLAPAAAGEAGRDALSGLHLARRLTERAQAVAPGHRHLPELLGTFEGRIGRLLGNAIDVNLGRWREARAHLEASVTQMQRFSAGCGHSAEGRRQHAWALVGLASWHRLAGDPVQALSLVEQSMVEIEAAVASAPDVAVYGTMATMMRTHLAAALAGAGRLDEAVALNQEALVRNEAARAADTANAVRHRDHALMLTGQARLMVEGGRTADALPLLREAHGVLSVISGLERDAYLTRWVAETEVLRARAELEAAADPATALSLVDHALQRLRHTPALQTMPQVAQVLQAQGEAVAGAAHARLGDRITARRRLQASVDHLATLTAAGEPLPRSLAVRQAAAQQALQQLETLDSRPSP